MPEYGNYMHQVDIADRQTMLELDPGFLAEVVRRTLTEENVAASEISVALVDDPEMQDLNRRWLEHDYPTDVLSFLFDSGVVPETDSGSNASGRWIEGEVIVGVETAVARASEFDWTPRDEVVLYLIHGLLHLVGYDDREPSDRDEMKRRERSLCSMLLKGSMIESTTETGRRGEVMEID